MNHQPLLQRQKRLLTLAGVVMLTYLVFHMLTNLSFFDKQNFESFYHFYNLPLIRWPILILFGAAIAIHAFIAVRIRRVNAQARKIQYQKHDKFHVPAPLVSLSIVFLFAFIAMHIVQGLMFDTSNIYDETIGLFESIWMVLFYLAGLFVLTMHLLHSAGNILQTLGKTSNTCMTLVATLTLLLTGGFALLPLYIYFVIL